MVINVSVQYNDAILPGIILLTLNIEGTHIISCRVFVPTASVPT